MIQQCAKCLRDFAPDEIPAHIALERLRASRDHTGPHGKCWRLTEFRGCICPDAVMSSILGWHCSCCDGDLSDAIGPPPYVGARL